MNSKQPALKPQDLFIVLKISVLASGFSSFANLGRDLLISASEIHAGVQRATTSHLLSKEAGALEVNRAALREFLLHGVQYAFPAVIGPVVRGLPTGVSAPPLRNSFAQVDKLPLVWPDPLGEVRGISLCPLYPTVPAACRVDALLYGLLAVVDALRGGAARERELAHEKLVEILK